MLPAGFDKVLKVVNYYNGNCCWQISHFSAKPETISRTDFYISCLKLRQFLALLEHIFTFLCKYWNRFLPFRNRFWRGVSHGLASYKEPTTVTSVAAIRAMGCAESYYSWLPTMECSSRKPKRTKNLFLKKILSLIQNLVIQALEEVYIKNMQIKIYMNH